MAARDKMVCFQHIQNALCYKSILAAQIDVAHLSNRRADVMINKPTTVKNNYIKEYHYELGVK